MKLLYQLKKNNMVFDFDELAFNIVKLSKLERIKYTA